MTNAQVFRWFCKEQKIMHLIQKMFYKIQPSKLEYTTDRIYSKYITFDEYINDRSSLYGFSYLLQRILDDYKRKIRVGMALNDYYPLSEALDKKFEKINKRWEYFAKNNIQLNPDSVKVGDVINFRDYGDERTMRVSGIDVTNSRIYGYLNTNGRSYGIYASYVTDENGKYKPLDYVIRRNRKVYHGAS